MVLGPKVEVFEEEFTRYCGVANGIGVGLGTDAISIALRAIGLRPGDEVLVPAVRHRRRRWPSPRLARSPFSSIYRLMISTSCPDIPILIPIVCVLDYLLTPLSVKLPGQRTERFRHRSPRRRTDGLFMEKAVSLFE